MKKPNLTFSSYYKQGIYKPKHPEKYVGDATKIIFRSSLELRYIKYFDENPNILRWGSEEIQIPYISPKDGRMHRYFPDFIVESLGKDGKKRKFIFEIKPKQQTIAPTGNPKSRKFLREALTYSINSAKWHFADKYAKKHNAQFVVLTEDQIKIKTW